MNSDSRERIAIEDRLHAAGYQTQRSISGSVNVRDPVFRSMPGSSELVLCHWKLVEVSTIREAWAFIEARS